MLKTHPLKLQLLEGLQCVINNQQVEPIVQTRNMVRAIKSRSVSAIPSNYTTVVESDYSVNSTNIYLANVLNVYAENDCTLTYFNQTFNI